MKKHFDDLGRIVIPKDMREELDFGNHDLAEIEIVNKRIIITNPKNIDKQAQVDFLIDRENKLQEIEYVLKNIKNIEIQDIKNILKIE